MSGLCMSRAARGNQHHLSPAGGSVLTLPPTPFRANQKLTDGAILELINFHLLLSLRRTDSSRIVSSTFNASGWQAHQCYLSVIGELEKNRNSLREGLNELVEEGLTLIK